MPLGAVSAVDGFAVAMVVILALSLGVVALLLACISRHARNRKSDVDELLDEVRGEDDSNQRPAAPTREPSRDPWERDEDWWK